MNIPFQYIIIFFFAKPSRVIDAHAASYSDNHAHYHHHHHPPSASIDLIAYAWMSPGHDIFSLPAAFSIQFGVSFFSNILFLSDHFVLFYLNRISLI
jgi:hypothetical protein